MFVHHFIMRFIRNPGPDASHIWDHGPFPTNLNDTSHCGAKQILFATLCTHYRHLLGRRKLDAATKDAFFELLYVLAANCQFGDGSVQICFSTTLARGHHFDFAEAGVAFLQPEEQGRTRVYIIREPLAPELAAYLGSKLDMRKLAVMGWELLLRLQLNGTGATVSEDCTALVAHERVCSEFGVTVMLFAGPHLGSTGRDVLH